MTIKKICKNKVITASFDTPVYEVANLMKKHNIGNVVIIDNDNKNTPIGIVTDRDIVVKAIADEVNLKDILAKDIMSDDLLMLKEHYGILESLDMMCAKSVRRAPVINDSGTLTGVISTDDLILLIANEIESYAKIVRKQLADAQI